MIEIRRIVVGPLATNCWAVHATGSRQALLIDPGDSPDRVLAAVADLEITAIVLTHAHFDHVLGVSAIDAPVLGHRAEEQVWHHELAYLDRHGHFDAGLDTAKLLAEGHSLTPRPGSTVWSFDDHIGEQTLRAGPLEVQVLHTPGHTPGGVTLAVPGHLVTGDTLVPGGPGLTGWPLSDFPTIIRSVRRLLHDFPADTVIHPGHGLDTTVGTEKPSLPEWAARGW
jgi:hydroxyacylglutathione hydrolase